VTIVRSPIRSPLRSPVYGPTTGPFGRTGTLADFTYDLDFVANTYKGGTQPYGNNNNDGRFFRDPSNTTATYCPDNTGLLILQAAAGLRRTNKGVFSYMSGTNSLLWNRDLTNVAWTKSASMTAAKTQTGADGAANSATLLTAGAASQTVSQSVTSASVQRVFSVDMKRVTGTGPILLSLDGGTTTTDVSGSLNSTTFTQVYATQNNLNPVATITIATSGDQVTVDFCQMCSTTISGLNIPTQQRYLTTTATVINSQTRPNVASADAGPLFPVTNAPFAFYWQGRSERPTGGYVITSDGNLFCNVDNNGAVHFSENPADSVTANSTWRSGLSQLNKVAGWVTNSNIKVACNGNLGSLGSGVVFSGSQTHWDLGTNGAGANTIMGITERVAFGPNITFSDAELIAMTT
jgi:hypothetical protein